MKKILKIIDLISKNRKNIYFKVPEKKVILLNSTRYNQAKYSFDNDIENNLFILPTHLDKSFKLFISFRIIYYFFFYYKKSSSVYESYFSACIKCLKARVVLDFSKYGFILNISKNFPKVNFVVVCDRVKRKINRNIDADLDYLEFLENYFKKNSEKIKNVNLFLRSERDKGHFEERGLEQNKTGLEYYVIGSFLADYVRENFYEDKKKNQILFISQVQIHSPKKLKQVVEVSTIKYLRKLKEKCEKYKIDCAFLLRAESDNLENLEYEKNFFNTYFKNENNIFYFRDKNTKDYGIYSYKKMMESKYICSINSAMSLEAVTFGSKNLYGYQLFGNYYKYSLLGETEKGNSYWNFLEIKEFDKKFEEFINCNFDEYIKKDVNIHKNIFKNSDIFAHNYLKSFIKKKIEN